MLQVAATVAVLARVVLVFLLVVLVQTVQVVLDPGLHTILEMNTTHQSNTPEPRIHTLRRTVPSVMPANNLPKQVGLQPGVNTRPEPDQTI